MSIQCSDFYVVVSAPDLVMWKGENDGDCVGNPYLILALSRLCININPVAIYFKYFEDTPVGGGDVHMHRQGLNGESVFAIDLYRDVYDQLDIIRFAVRTKKNVEATRSALRSFFDSAKYQIMYQESHISNEVSALIDVKSYPKKIEQSGYSQKLILEQHG